MLSLALFVSLLLIFVGLNILDVHSTYLVVSAFGIGSEKNPIAKLLLRKFGNLKGLIFLKSILIFIIPLMIWAYLMSPFEINLTLIIANLLYFFVVVNNYRIYKKKLRMVVPNEKMDKN